MQSLNRLIYGPTTEEKIRSWQAKIRSEQRQLDREIRQVCHHAHYAITHPLRVQQLDIATKKVQTQVKQLAQKGQVGNAKLLAKEVVRSHKQKDRLTVNKARLGSINVQLQHQLCKLHKLSYGTQILDAEYT